MGRRFEHGGNIYQEGPGEGKWLDFSANINPLGLSSKVREAIVSHIGAVVHYPDPQGRELKNALAARYGVDGGSLVLGNGAAELFYLYAHCARPRRVLIPIPSFSEYERAALAAGAIVDYVPMDASGGFSFPLEEMLRRCPQDGCIIIGNPNNPTGTMLTKEGVAALAERAKSCRSDLLVDESFLDFRGDGDDYSARFLVEQYDNLAVIRSLTKFFAIPGLRLGFAVANKKQVRMWEGHKDVWNVNSLAQAAGVAALQDEAYQEQSRQYVAAAGRKLFERMAAWPQLRVFPPAANFILACSLLPELTGAALSAALKKEGILIRDCSNYPGLTPYYFRIAVRTREENALFCQVLDKVLRGYEAAAGQPEEGIRQ